MIALVLAAASGGQGLFLVLLVPFVIFMVIRKRLITRPCPRCGERVKNGQIKCYACGFDFSVIGEQPVAQATKKPPGP